MRSLGQRVPPRAPDQPLELVLREEPALLAEDRHDRAAPGLQDLALGLIEILRR